jgi:hypothetical protein
MEEQSNTEENQQHIVYDNDLSFLQCLILALGSLSAGLIISLICSH